MKSDMLGTMTPDDFAAGLDRLCETFEACRISREDIICELEAKVFELRGEPRDAATEFERVVAFMPLP